MRFIPTIFVLSLTIAGASNAASHGLTVDVEGVPHNTPIPAEQAVCLPTKDGKSDATGKNKQPTIYWNGAPEDTDSFAIFIMDVDVPADFTDAGKEGKVIAHGAKRQNFFHYAVVDIPATATQYPAPDKTKPYGKALANDMGMNKYVKPVNAYGGPCPPWNDERIHHYHYIVLALSKGAPINLVNPVAHAKRTSADEPNIAKNTFNRLINSKYVLANGTQVGTYTLNPALRSQAAKR
jgi:phosphatidylethanolamine-binding protein (PEBP) family uncharacterized protein